MDPGSVDHSGRRIVLPAHPLYRETDKSVRNPTWFPKIFGQSARAGVPEPQNVRIPERFCKSAHFTDGWCSCPRIDPILAVLHPVHAVAIVIEGDGVDIDFES